MTQFEPSGFKRFLIGRPVRSNQMAQTLLPKRIALPVFASDALSSVAYAPDEILLTLSIAGVGALTLSPWVAVAVVVVLVVVIASYRQNVYAYPSGGGDYEVVTHNLGKTAGLTVGSALLVDYVLTVAVSVSAGAQYVVSAVPALRGYQVGIALAVILVLMMLNLRGVREAGRAFAIPTYLYMAVIGLMLAVGFTMHSAGDLGIASSASYQLTAEPAYTDGLVGLAGALLVLRAFSSGCAALTGVEAISNGVPVFRKPKSRNAAVTLALLGAISAAMMLGIITLSRWTGVKYVADPATQLLTDGAPVGSTYHQDPVIAQIASVVFSSVPGMLVVVSLVTGLILVLAANTAFNGFPSLGSILARDGYLPRQLANRGDKLAFSNGILTLAVAAAVLVAVFGAEVTRLIQLYIVGVFISFTLSQLGMVRHWNRALRLETDRSRRYRMLRSRVVNLVGFLMTGTVLIVVLITKTTHGAWLTLLAMSVIFLAMRAIRRHYDAVAVQLAVKDPDAARALPARTHGVVLVSGLNLPALRAIAFARATRPNSLEAVHVLVGDDGTELRREWEKYSVPIPLTLLAAPYRDISRPIVDYIKDLRLTSPRDLIVVFIPEYLVQHWWQQALHNQSALRLRARLVFIPRVVITSVPWVLSDVKSATSHD